jgi:hypothetical protein
MKKLFLITTLLISTSLFSYNEKTSSEFDLSLGGKLDVKNSANQFRIGAAIGGATTKFLFNYDYISAMNGHGLRIGLLVDIPFHFAVGKKHYMAIAPTFDLGPEFIFGKTAGVSSKTFDFMPIGFGIKGKYYFSEKYGFSLTPFHMTMSFARYIYAGGGHTLNKDMQVTYDILASFFMRW